MRRLFGLLLSSLAALGLLFAFPALASAHDVLQKTTPSDGQSLPQMPANVSLQFSEPPLAIGTQVLVKGPSGDVATGKAKIEGSTVVQAISPTAPAGKYTVTYRVSSDDGHPVGGTFSFQARLGAVSDDGVEPTPTTTPTVTTSAPAPAPSAPAPAPAPAPAATAVAAPSTPASADQPSSTLPVLLTVVGVIAVIGIGAFFVVRSRPKA